MKPAPQLLMPAEWAPHAASWISWPYNPETWPGHVEAAQAAMAAIVRALAEVEPVHVNVQDERIAAELEQGFADVAPGQLLLERIPTDDAWIRDYGAIIVSSSDGAAVAVDFGYNAWGGKYPPFDRDCAVAGQMAARLGVPVVDGGLILEGGSVDVNGQGLGLVTEQCLLNPNRNPDLNRADIEARLAASLGLHELIWLGDGVVGDDTDGHIDNLARFVDPDTVVVLVEPDRSDPNHAALAENLKRLTEYRGPQGGSLTVVELPAPDPVWHEGSRLPASYANFYIANGLVLVPQYGGSRDAQALSILADCFPGRRITGIDCRPLVVGLGAIHCLTQQVPAIVSGPVA